jgi:hypothetical protein
MGSQLVATRAAMDIMGFHSEDQDSIFTALAGLLHLGARARCTHRCAAARCRACPRARASRRRGPHPLPSLAVFACLPHRRCGSAWAVCPTRSSRRGLTPVAAGL